MKKIIFVLLVAISIYSCNNSEAIPIADNTFVLNNRVYTVINNEITELADLEEDTIPKTLKPDLKTFGETSIAFVKTGASTELSGVYRGNVLFVKMELYGMNDLREKYSGNGLSVNLKDEYGFNLKTINIDKGEMIRVIGVDNKTSHFVYNGGIPLNAEVYKAIEDYDISSSLNRKNW
jgi:hypothetical protein